MMRKGILLIVVFFIAICVHAERDTTSNRKSELVKKGWNLGPIPIIAFDTDLGLEYGGLLNFFDYGDGTIYPSYRQSVYLEVSRYTKGSGLYRVNYDSKYLVKGLRVTADFTYMPNLANDFFGFNGSESVFNKSWIKSGRSDYRSEMFYKMNKDYLRGSVDFQGMLSKRYHLSWLFGAAFVKYNVGPLKSDKLDIADSPSYDKTKTLYDKYVEWGIIQDWEKRGGNHIMLKGGVVYDTRDNEPNPMSGIWADAVLQYFTTNLNGNGNGGVAKLTATFRQYFTIIPNDLSFAYRVIAQQTVAGKSPFYIAPVIGSSIVNRASFEGMGGAYSLRGIFRNRVVGDGIVMVNTELRYKFWRLRLLNQNFYWAITMFGDGGMVTDKVDVKMPNLPQEEQALYFKDVAQRPHFSYGVGGKLAMNQNFVISGDIGKAVSSQDGSIGVYIGVNFLF